MPCVEKNVPGPPPALSSIINTVQLHNTIHSCTPHRWFKKREKSHSTVGVRSGSNESVSAPPAKGTKREAGRGGQGIVTGSLRINVSGLQGDKQGTDLDIPYIEDTSASKPKVIMGLIVGSVKVYIVHFTMESIK